MPNYRRVRKSRRTPSAIPVLAARVRRAATLGDVIGFTVAGHQPVVPTYIRRIGRNGQKFLGVKRCPFCGEEHGHGVGSGERVADCGRGGYVLFSHDDGGKGVPSFLPVRARRAGGA